MSIEVIINLIATLGVIISVVFLGFQIRKSTQFTKANYYDSLANSNTNFLSQLVQDPKLAKLFEAAIKDWNSLSKDDKRTSNFLFIQVFRMWENMFFQNRIRILDNRNWKQHENTIISYFNYTGVQQWWKYRRQTFSEEFIKFLESSKEPKKPIIVIEDVIETNNNNTNQKN
jgi:hypothetical protein